MYRIGESYGECYDRVLAETGSEKQAFYAAEEIHNFGGEDDR